MGDVDEAMQTAARVLAALEPEGPTRTALRTLADAAKGE